MIDHVTIGVSDLARSAVFYDQILNTLGIGRLYAEGALFVGYGRGDKAFFWIGAKVGAITGVHVAFAVADRETVDRFHATGLAAGGLDNGGPGLRPHYHETYYGAFVLTRMGTTSRRSVIPDRSRSETVIAGLDPAIHALRRHPRATVIE